MGKNGDSPAHRIRRGLCPTCPGPAPVQLFEINKRLGGLRRELGAPVDRPGLSRGGVCLVCRPGRADPDGQEPPGRGSDDYTAMVEGIERRRAQAREGGRLGATDAADRTSGAYSNNNSSNNNNGDSGARLGQQTSVQQQQRPSCRQTETLTLRLPAGSPGVDDVALWCDRCVVVVSDDPNSPLRAGDEIVSINGIEHSAMANWDDWTSLLRLTCRGERTALVARPIVGGDVDAGDGGVSSSAQYGNRGQTRPRESVQLQPAEDYSRAQGYDDYPTQYRQHSQQYQQQFSETMQQQQQQQQQQRNHSSSEIREEGSSQQNTEETLTTTDSMPKSDYGHLDNLYVSEPPQNTDGTPTTVDEGYLDNYLDNLYISEPPPANRAEPDDDRGSVVDALAQLIAQHVRVETGEDLGPRPLESLLFFNDALGDGMSDDISVLTPAMSLRDDVTTSTASFSRAFREMDTERRRLDGPPAGLTAMPRRIREESTEVDRLRDQADELIGRELDGEMIGLVRDALNDNNRGERSEEVALFCLAKLRMHARLSTKFRRKIARVDGAVGAVVETLTLFSEDSPDVALDGCGLVWLLCTSDGDRGAVVGCGGAESVLNCCLAWKEDGEVATLAIGALRALSYDPEARAIIRDKDGVAIAFEVMNEQVTSAEIQTEGCAVLELLSVDAENVAVHAVSSLEVEAGKFPRLCVSLLLAHGSNSSSALTRIISKRFSP